MKFFLLILFILSGCKSEDCISTKAAFDIGSASTKMVVAKVDRCQHKIDKILYQAQTKINYKESLKNSSAFPTSLITEGITKLRELKTRADKYHPSAYFAVATEAFRNATNGQDAIKKITNDLNVKGIIISQEQEAKLGFMAAKSLASKQNVVVWDIGGGSMQISDGKHIYRGKLASVTFKNQIISKIKKSKQLKSPNPLSKKERHKAIRMAIGTAEKDVPQEIKRSIHTKHSEIIGIGSVHFHSIARQLNKEQYTVRDLDESLEKKAGLTDKKLGGEYASTDYSNLCLVYGFMKGLGIKKVKAVNVNLAHGLLVNDNINL